MLRRLTFVVAVVVTVVGTALAQTTTNGVGETQAQPLTALPQDATTVTNWLEQNVYDHSGKMVGEIAEALVNKNGRFEAFIMSIGGLVGPDGKMGVVIPFGAVSRIEKNGKWFLTMDSTKEALRASTVFNLTEPRGLGFRNKVRCGFASAWLHPDLDRRTGQRWPVQLSQAMTPAYDFHRARKPCCTVFSDFPMARNDRLWATRHSF